MSRREIIELDQIPEEMEESVPKRQRTSQRKSSQSQRPKEPSRRLRSEVTTLTRSRGSEAAVRPGSLDAVVAAASTSSRPEGAVVAAASRLSRAEDVATTVPHIRLWYTDDGHDELERKVALHCLYTMSVIEADSFRVAATTVPTAGYSMWVIFARWRPR